MPSLLKAAVAAPIAPIRVPFVHPYRRLANLLLALWHKPRVTRLDPTHIA